LSSPGPLKSRPARELLAIGPPLSPPHCHAPPQSSSMWCAMARPTLSSSSPLCFNRAAAECPSAVSSAVEARVGTFSPSTLCPIQVTGVLPPHQEFARGAAAIPVHGESRAACAIPASCVISPTSHLSPFLHKPQELAGATVVRWSTTAASENIK
jgi:hypothetical protein